VIRDIFDSLENVLYMDFGSCKDRCAKRDGYGNSEKIDGLKESQHKIFILEEYESLAKDYDSDELVAFTEPGDGIKDTLLYNLI
jgi:hypothetical protein